MSELSVIIAVIGAMLLSVLLVVSKALKWK